jgi:hypothetical protein
VVDDKEIAKFVGLWMILNDATKPRVIEWATSHSRDVLEAAHYAYESLSSPVVHRRRFELDKENLRLTIIDNLEGSGAHNVKSYLHVAPHVVLELVGCQEAIAVGRNGRYRITASVGQFSVGETWFSPTYGVRQNKRTLVLNISAIAPVEIVTVISA